MSTLLLSGWSQPVDALSHLVDDGEAVLFDYSDYPNSAAAIEALRVVPHQDVIAWSLGGQLALKAMLAGAIAPRHLTMIAAPIQFVSENAELPGMGAETYRLFRDSYARDAARTKTRFHGLIAKGDAQMRQVIELLGHHPKVEEVSRFLPWLEELAASKLDVAGLANPPPTFMVHGMNDHIVPHAQSVALAAALPTATLSSWANVGHAPHLHDAARLRAEIAAHRAKHGVVA